MTFMWGRPIDFNAKVEVWAIPPNGGKPTLSRVWARLGFDGLSWVRRKRHLGGARYQQRESQGLQRRRYRWWLCVWHRVQCRSIRLVAIGRPAQVRW